MDDELKVVVSSVLEADVDESAQRIASQLPSIAEKVNAKSSIKIGVELERNATQNMTQQISRELSKASRQAVGVSVNLDTSAIQKFQSELDKLGVNDKVTQAISAEMDRMGVRIDQISGAWKEATEGERQLLNLTIQGTDQLGRKVSIAKQFAYTLDEETAELQEQSSTITRMTADLEKQRQTAERLAAQERKNNEDRIASVTQYRSMLNDIVLNFTGKTSAKPLMDESHLNSLRSELQSIVNELDTMASKSGKLTADEKANISAQIDGIKRLAKEYQNVEYVATKLRTKTVVQVNTEQVEKLKEFEERLRSSGILTQEFQNKINNLRGDLGKAFDNKSLTEYLNGFDRLQSDVASFQEKIRSINSIYTELGKISSEINTIQRSLVGLSPSNDSTRIAALKEQLAIYEEQKAQLEAQLVPYGTMIDYAKQKTVYDQQAKVLAGELAIAEAAVADNAAKIDVAMQSIPSAVEAIRARFAQLTSPTQELIQRVSQLDAEMRAVSNAKTDQEKISAYKQLAETIKYCRTEITSLSTAQRKDILDVKFTAGLEKAKADLATIARTWSAFKQDDGLNAQFKQLAANLQRVNSQADLTKWTAQFNAFKSEVKAAGLNVQSLADTLKNNLGKVLQWVSATTLLFRAFRLLKSAVSTVVELDTAMVDLRKVTTGTTADYKAFYQTANDTAKALNATTEAVISQTAEWARLGYSLKDASKLAENAMIFAAVSPGMDQTAATDGLVSIIKAYGIEVEDTLDGIISKVNDIGNKFAVSNADIVEALTRSSSAMAAANNTFEETVALATAAIEITRDANTVGNALKTLSMRIRGYDEETEEYSEDIAILTGKIADFTRTASNPTGVTLFTDATNQTYRSTYEILSDIADVFDEISDVDQARLLENLFGKRQAQVGAAILSNFEQARKSIETMENSAGSAGREMEKIMDSLDYKINALKETWTGVAQNLFQQEDLKLVVEALITLSNLIDALTSKLGLFGTVTLAGVIGWLVQVRSAMSAINTAITPVLQTVANISFDGSAASALQYAAALSGLDAAQQKVVMSASGLSAAEQAQVMDMIKVIAVTKQYTVAELEKALGMEAGTLAASLNVSATTMVTEELLRAAIANGTLSAEQLKAIVTTNAQTGAMIAQAGAAQTLGVAMKAATAAMLTNPLGWITLAIGLIPLVISGISKLIVTQEEANELMEKSFSNFEEATSKVESLNDELETTKNRIEELEAKDSLTFVEESELQKLRESIELLTIQADLAEKERIRAAKESANATVNAYHKNFKGAMTQERLDRYIATSTSTGNNAIMLDSTDNVAAMLAGIYQMKKLRDECEAGSEEFLRYQEVIDRTSDVIWEQANLLNTYKSNLEAIPYDELTSEQQQAFDEISAAIQLVYQNLDPAKWKEIQWNSIVSNDKYANDVKALKNLAATAEITADTIRNQFPSLVQACEDAGLEIEDVVNNINGAFDRTDGAGVSRYTASLSDLSDVISKVKSSYDLLETAQSDMVDGGGLTPETIAKLADAEENYLDYLYEENGVIKLNTKAWRENANAKMQSEMAEIQKEIDAIEEENAAIREQIKEKEALRSAALEAQDLTMYYAYYNAIDSLNDKISANNELITENQNKLKVYGALYDSFFDPNIDVWDFSSLVSSLNDVESSVSDIVSAMDSLKNGTALTVEELSKLALKYPDLLKASTLFTDTSIANQQSLLDSVLSTYEAEYDALIDTKIAELTATNEMIKSQIELENEKKNKVIEIADLQSNGKLDSEDEYQKLLNELRDLEGQNFVEYSNGVLDVNKELLENMIEQQGEKVDDSRPIWGALGSMIVEGHSKGLTGALKTFPDYLTRLQQWADGSFSPFLSRIGTNLQKALAGDTDFLKAVGLPTGMPTDPIGQNLWKAAHNVPGGTVTIDTTVEGSYTIDGKSIDDWAADYQENIERRVQTLTEQITANETIIKNLEKLKGLDLKSIYDAGHGSRSSSSTKDVEEYIADIDKFREAIEALRKARVEAGRIESEIENAGSYEKKIALEKELIEAYKAEQAALHNLNDVRDNTISKSVEALRALGFEVEYNADTNDLWISNMEHLNELTADSKGKYDTLQEATNALRQDTEDLINTITELNDDNRENSATWMELRRQIVEATIAQYEYALQVRENAIMLAEDGMDNAINTKSLANVKKFSTDIINHYQAMQQTLHEEAEYYRSLGYSDTSDEVSKLSDLWWDYADNIKKVKEQVVDYLIDIVDEAHNAVDEIQNVFDTLYEAADEFAANDGFITVDTYQALLQLGPQYMQMLKDENGLWQINEERINDVIAARTQQLAVENAMAYVERIKLATQEGSIEDLNNLVFATTNATSSTWGLVYAELELMHTMGDLNDSQYAAALHNIEVMQDLANNVVANIGKATNSVATNLEETRKQLEKTKDGLQDLLDELEDMQNGANDLVKYVMDMLKHRIKEQISLIEEMRDKYSELIQLKKDSLDATKDEQNYQKTIAKKLKEMAKLQERINALALDDSRSAQAERAKLLEELAALQEDLEDTQADKSIDAQKEALDQMEKDYHEEKDKEIKILEDSISSYQKLYDMAIAYIRDNWDTLYSELIAWNYEYGSVLNSEITAAWEAAQAAAQRYGDFVSAIMGGISAEIDSITAQIEALNAQISNLNTSSSGSGIGASGTDNKNTTVGEKGTTSTPSNEDAIHSIIKRMYANSQAWFSSNEQQRRDLETNQFALAAMLKDYGINAVRDDAAGVWYVDRIGGEQLYEKYRKYTYHTGGFVGDEPLKPNERYIKAEDGELILTSDQQDSIATQIGRMSAMTEKFLESGGYGGMSALSGLSGIERGSVNSAITTNNNNKSIVFNQGDVTIQGTVMGPKELAQNINKYIKTTEEMVNQFARLIGVKW